MVVAHEPHAALVAPAAGALQRITQRDLVEQRIGRHLLVGRPGGIDPREDRRGQPCRVDRRHDTDELDGDVHLVARIERDGDRGVRQLRAGELLAVPAFVHQDLHRGLEVGRVQGGLASERRYEVGIAEALRVGGSGEPMLHRVELQHQRRGLACCSLQA